MKPILGDYAGNGEDVAWLFEWDVARDREEMGRMREEVNACEGMSGKKKGKGKYSMSGMTWVSGKVKVGKGNGKGGKASGRVGEKRKTTVEKGGKNSTPLVEPPGAKNEQDGEAAIMWLRTGRHEAPNIEGNPSVEQARPKPGKTQEREMKMGTEITG